MSGGEPLTDADRIAWLDALIADVAVRSFDRIVIACSALTPFVQDKLRHELPAAHISWCLLELDRDTLTRRMLERSHFMPPELLSSQFNALCPPDDVIRLDASRPVDQLILHIRSSIHE